MKRKPCARCGHTQRVHHYRRRVDGTAPCSCGTCPNYEAPKIDGSLAVPIVVLVAAFGLLTGAYAQADANHPTYVPGTRNKVLWPPHDAACDNAMDKENWDAAVGPPDADTTDGLCYQALKEYGVALDLVTKLDVNKTLRTIILNHLSVNEAMTDVEIAWGEKAQGNDAVARHAIQAAIHIYGDVKENYDGSDPYIPQEFYDMFSRIETLYPDLVPADMRESH